jgi:ParB/RepB/Spo0J family partition protein
MASSKSTSINKAKAFKNARWAGDDINDPDPNVDVLYSPEISRGIRKLSFVLFSEILEDSPVQSRAEVFDPNTSSKDKELLESIKVNGVVQPIVVRSLEDSDDNLGFGIKEGDRKFAIVAGHRRVAAGKAAGLKGTEAMISRSDDDHELITLAENMGRRELSSYERALALKSLQERKGLSVRKVSDAAGVSHTLTSRLFSALSAPRSLHNAWVEGSISTDVVVDLKNHWGAFEQLKDSSMLGKIKGLTQAGAKSLRDQLDTGTDLADALTSMSSPSLLVEQGVVAAGKRGPYKKSTKSELFKNNKAYKESFIAAVQDVFSKIDQDKAEDLFNIAISQSVNDADTLWAAAGYVAKGGDQKNAVELAQAAMQIPGARSLINKEIQLMKKAAANLNKIKSKDKSVAPFVKKYFPGI